MDERIKKLAYNLVNYSCNIKQGEKVLIEAGIKARPLVLEIIKQIYKVNAMPFVRLKDASITRELLNGISASQASIMKDYMYPIISSVDAYIGISAVENSFELSSVPKDNMKAFNIHYQKPIHHDVRVQKTKWVILQYPTKAFSQSSGMDSESFEDFYFNVCNLDYQKMNNNMEALKNLMEKTNKVHIVSPNTDLTFSIKNMKAIKCAGEMNIPDGEVYTAPVKDSVNGYITYNVPTLYNGIRFDNVFLEFENGKIVKATSQNNTDKLNEILNTDDGARFIGEFSLGVNPYILYPMLDILFDEKICGSFHFTPGSCYNDAYNGNISAVHWDMVQIQRKEYGGGKILFDDVLIRQDGIFVIDELKCLNPNNLK